MKAKRITFNGFDGKDYRGIYVGSKRGMHTIVYTVYSPALSGPVTAVLNKDNFKARVTFAKRASRCTS